METLASNACAVCGSAVSRLRHVRLDGRLFCGHACAATARLAALKARLDPADGSPVVCRCVGAPEPLEPAGPHCARCRRMFSAGIRLWLVRRERRSRLVGFDGLLLWLEELAAQLRLSAGAPPRVSTRS